MSRQKLKRFEMRKFLFHVLCCYIWSFPLLSGRGGGFLYLLAALPQPAVDVRGGDTLRGLDPPSPAGQALHHPAQPLSNISDSRHSMCCSWSPESSTTSTPSSTPSSTASCPRGSGEVSMTSRGTASSSRWSWLLDLRLSVDWMMSLPGRKELRGLQSEDEWI